MASPRLRAHPPYDKRYGEGESIVDILSRYNTDKNRLHTYGPVYDKYLAPERDRILTVLEIGVMHGESLLAWRDAFHNAFIVGMDIHPPLPEEPIHRAEGLKIVKGRQHNTHDLHEIGEEYGPFDLIIDDGSHKPEHYMTSLLYLWKYLAPYGFYFIEDIQTIDTPAFQHLPCTVYNGSGKPFDDNMAIFNRER